MTDRWMLALDTDGFFAEEEAEFLRDQVDRLPGNASLLEVGSYKGRSSQFILASMAAEQRLVCVDVFRAAASYEGHSYAGLRIALNDPRVTVLPMTLRSAFRHLHEERFALTLVDADHSYTGAVEDLCLSVALAARGSTLLCHDVDEELFPGVVAAIESLVARGVLLEVGERVGSLGGYEVISRPTWLIDPGVYRDEELPEVVALPSC